MTTSSGTFHQFAKLPPELHDEIWRHCLPSRVFELDGPVSDCTIFRLPHEPIDSPTPCNLEHTSHMNAHPPLITRGCRESRAAAFETGSIPEFAGAATSSLRDAWLDPLRNSFHTSWSGVYEADFSYGGQEPLACLEWETSRALGRGSLTVQYLDVDFGSPHPYGTWDAVEAAGEFEGYSTRSCMSRPWYTDVREEKKALDLIPDLQVVMRILVVHAPLRDVAGLGLFGLLEDAPVQIVELSDTANPNTLLSLARDCEPAASVTTSQDFGLESAELTARKLRELVFRTYWSEELAARMRPAVMFRLCTKMCNHGQSG